MFNVQDLRNMQVFLNRTDLKGQESMAMAEIQIKISNGIQQMENPETPPETPPSTPAGKTDGPDGNKSK